MNKDTRPTLMIMSMVTIVFLLLWLTFSPKGRSDMAKTRRVNDIVNEASRLGDEARDKAFCDYYRARITKDEAPYAYQYCYKEDK